MIVFMTLLQQALDHWLTHQLLDIVLETRYPFLCACLNRKFCALCANCMWAIVVLRLVTYADYIN